MDTMKLWQRPKPSITGDVYFYLNMAQANSNQSCWRETPLVLHCIKLVSLGTLPFLFDQNHSDTHWKGPIFSNLMVESYNNVQGKGNEERLFWSSQLTGIIHMLLTDTHLKKGRKREQGEKILNNGFQLQYWQDKNHKAKNHRKVITVNVWEGWYRTPQLVHVWKTDFLSAFSQCLPAWPIINRRKKLADR